jgi:hypothetical protein
MNFLALICKNLNAYFLPGNFQVFQYMFLFIYFFPHSDILYLVALSLLIVSETSHAHISLPCLVFGEMHMLQLSFFWEGGGQWLHSESGLGRLFEVARSHTHTHTHTVGLLWTGDQLIAEAAAYTTHNKHETNVILYMFRAVCFHNIHFYFASYCT